MDKAKTKKIVNVLSNIILGIFLVICVFSVIITLLSKKDSDGTAEIFGYQLRIITSESMAECPNTDVSNFEIKSIPLRSLIFVETVPDDREEAKKWYSELNVGDVLTFKYVYTTQVTITHRIISIDDNGNGGYKIILAGDNKNSEGGQLTQTLDTSLDEGTNYIIGKVTGQSRVVGAILSVLKTTLGIILLIMVPCVLIIGYEVSRIVRVYSDERKKKYYAEQEKKDKEIRELRDMIAKLEENQSSARSDKANDEKTEGDK